MGRLKYPIGIQTFSKIIEGGYTYVDKTRFIGELVYEERYYFLSRPRRFGKSLLLSTLHAYFDGRRELFRGLDLDKMYVDWTPRPVIHFDLNSEDFTYENGLANLLDRLLAEYELKYELTEIATTLPGRFAVLIETIYRQTGKKVIILVDEYDKPLLALDENKKLFESNQTLLKAFFGNLKSMDRFIGFAFLTGVARFNKVSIFSDLNNLDDISLSEDYAEICGWTEEELLTVFRSGIEDFSKERNESIHDTVTALRNFYDGYLFTPKGKRLYNPFSVLRSLRNKVIEPYWFETGTPTFLARRVKKYGIVPPSISEGHYSREDLLGIGADYSDPLPLMFQTGYLTIDSYDPVMKLFTLRFPNREVEIGFAKQLLRLYIPSDYESAKEFSISQFKYDLYHGNPEGFLLRMQTLFKGLASELQNEGNYQSIVWLLCTLSGAESLLEHHSYRGRSDLEVHTPENIYVFEFKYNRSVSEAMHQLHARDYAGRYAGGSRSLYLIGVNFSLRDSGRGMEWEIEKV